MEHRYFDFTDSISLNLKETLRLFYDYLDVNNYNDIEEYNKKISKRLGFDKDYHDDLIKNCYLLLEDTECAIQDFLEFELKGISRLKNNIGERYLRLYGFLSAIWLQRSILIKLAKEFNLQIIDLKTTLDDHAIVKFRNIAASHTLDFFGNKHFWIVQKSILNYNGNIIYYDNSDGRNEINLLGELKEFKRDINKWLHQICVRIFDKILNKDSKVYSELSYYLKYIEMQLNGGIVTRDHNNVFSIVEFKDFSE